MKAQWEVEIVNRTVIIREADGNLVAAGPAAQVGVTVKVWLQDAISRALAREEAPPSAE